MYYKSKCGSVDVMKEDTKRVKVNVNVMILDTDLLFGNTSFVSYQQQKTLTIDNHLFLESAAWKLIRM